jgi:hypothetical protein
MATLVIDWASTDGVYKPDLAKAKAAGMRVASVRSVYGRRAKGQVDSKPVYLDPCWSLNKDAIKAAGIRRTNYGFCCMPRDGFTTPEPEVQAQAQIDYGELERPTPGGYCGDYAPCFDVEEESKLSPEAYGQWCLRYAKTLLDHYGCWPIMYWSKRVWQEYLGGKAPPELGHCLPWIAKPWPVAPGSPIILDGNPNQNPATVPQYGDSTYWLWYQYQGDAKGMPGFTGYVDASRPQVVRRGMKGTIVKAIQRRVGATVDGDFGPATESAVKEFQCHWLGPAVADGIVGADTWAPMSWVLVDDLPTATGRVTVGPT